MRKTSSPSDKEIKGLKCCKLEIILAQTFPTLFFIKTATANPNRVAKTKSIHEIIQAEIEVRPSTLGELSMMVLKMLIKTRKMVTRTPNHPLTASGEIKKLSSQCYVF